MINPAAKGYVSQIYSGSAVDGPGLRCVVFLSGCNLRCPFCHNPETFLQQNGEMMTAQQTAEKVLRYKSFIKDGGVTFSGGEPFMQPRFVLSTMAILKAEGIHCAVQTNATLPDTRLISAADLIIADVKNFDGKILQGTEEFLRQCNDKGVAVWLTNVIVRGVNDDLASLKEIKLLASRFDNVQKMMFLPFKKYCTDKYQKLNMDFPYADKPETEAQHIASVKRLYDSIEI